MGNKDVGEYTRAGFAVVACLCVLLHATTNFVLTRVVFFMGLAAVLAVMLGVLPGWQKKLRPVDWAWLATLIAFPAYIHGLIGFDDEAGWGYARHSRLLLYPLPWWLAATQFRLPLKHLAASTALAAVIVFAWTAILRFGYGHSRAWMIFGGVEAGVICSLVAVLGMGLFGVCRGRLRAAVFAGALLAMAATIFTGTRGAQLVLPIASVAGLQHYWPVLGRRERAGASLALAVFWAMFLSVPQLGLTPRWKQAETELADYRAGALAGLSVDLRLAWYEAGLGELARASLFGRGHTGWLERQKELVSEGKLAQRSIDHLHLHNQWLDVGVKAGWVGLILVSLVLFLPLLRFSRAWWCFRYGDAYRDYAFCGFLVALAINLACLTDLTLWMANPVMLYVTLGVVLSGQLVRIENEAEEQRAGPLTR